MITDLDHQNSLDEVQLVAFCATAQDLELPVQCRIKHTRHTYLIGNYLDLGPAGIMVPEVEDEAVVDAAVRAFYYPQVGGRSWGGTARMGLNERPDRLEYAAWWNVEIIHGSGSPAAEWLQMYREYDLDSATELAKSLAGRT